MKKTKKKINKKRLLSISLTTLFIGGSAGAGVVIALAINGNFDNVDMPAPDNSVADQKYGFKVNTYKDKSGQAYINKFGLDELVKKIDKELGHGPEIYGLNTIHIGASQYVDDDYNGVYYTSLETIVINTVPLAQKIGYDAPTELKVEMIWQVLFHEYGHHIAASYLETTISENESANIYGKFLDTRENLHWNKDFVTRFKHLLGYDSNTLPWQHPNIIYHEKKYKYLQTIIRSNGLFEISNGKKVPDYNWLNSYPGIDVIYQGFNAQFVPQAIQASTLNYLFTMDELYTRKYQQLRMPFHHYINKKDSKYAIQTNGWIRKTSENGVDEDYFLTPFLYDATRYQDGIHPGMISPKEINHDIANKSRANKNIDHNSDESNPLIKKVVSNFRFFNDTPFNTNGTPKQINLNGKSTTTTDELYKLMLDHMGQTNGSDISYITIKNDSKIYKTTSYIVGGDVNKMKFGGFVKGTTDKYVGWQNKDGSFTWKSIKLEKFNYNSKHDFLSDQQIITPQTINPNSDDYFYITNDWIDKGDIVNKTLYFASDQNGLNKHKLTSIKNRINGRTQTWHPHLPSQFSGYGYEAYLSNGDVKIKVINYDDE